MVLKEIDTDTTYNTRRQVAKIALIVIILVGFVALLSLTLGIPDKLGKPIFWFDFPNHPLMPIIFVSLFFLGVLLALFLGARVNILLLVPLLLVAIPPLAKPPQHYLPPGTVLAFNLQECPRELGWEPFESGQNRVIVGTGPERVEHGIALSKRVLGNTGGAERRVITGRELPRHNHINGKYNRLVKADRENTTRGNKHVDTDDPGDLNEINLARSAVIRPSGHAKPRAHENMPPYVVLRYCIKR